VTDVKRDRWRGAVSRRREWWQRRRRYQVAQRCGGGGGRLRPAKRCSASFKMAGSSVRRRPPNKARQIQNRPRPKSGAAPIYKGRPPMPITLGLRKHFDFESPSISFRNTV